MDEDTLKSIDRKLDMLLKIVAVMAAEGKTLSEGAPLLYACGLDRQTIAEIYDTSPSSVSVRLSEAKKQRKNSA